MSFKSCIQNICAKRIGNTWAFEGACDNTTCGGQMNCFELFSCGQWWLIEWTERCTSATHSFLSPAARADQPAHFGQRIVWIFSPGQQISLGCTVESGCQQFPAKNRTRAATWVTHRQGRGSRPGILITWQNLPALSRRRWDLPLAKLWFAWCELLLSWWRSTLTPWWGSILTARWRLKTSSRHFPLHFPQGRRKRFRSWQHNLLMLMEKSVSVVFSLITRERHPTSRQARKQKVGIQLYDSQKISQRAYLCMHEYI